MADTTPTSVLDALVDDLLYLTSEGLIDKQAYVRHPEDVNAAIVETYTLDGEVEGRYTVTFNIEKQEN